MYHTKTLITLVFWVLKKKVLNAGVLGGVVMIIIAVVWFFARLAGGIIFYYPPILLIVGVIKGIAKGNLAVN